METKETKRELNPEEMEQVSGGNGNTESQPAPNKPQVVISYPKKSDKKSNYPFFRGEKGESRK